MCFSTSPLFSQMRTDGTRLLLQMEELIDHLGPLEGWPTYVLEYLFLDRRLCPTYTSKLRRVMIFFFWKQCTRRDGVYLLRRVQRVYGGFGPFRGGQDPGVVLRMDGFKQ